MTIGSQSSNALPLPPPLPTLSQNERAAASQIHRLLSLAQLNLSPSFSLTPNYKSCQRDLDFALLLIELREKPIKFWRFHELSEESLWRKRGLCMVVAEWWGSSHMLQYFEIWRKGELAPSLWNRLLAKHLQSERRLKQLGSHFDKFLFGFWVPSTVRYWRWGQPSTRPSH